MLLRSLSYLLNCEDSGGSSSFYSRVRLGGRCPSQTGRRPMQIKAGVTFDNSFFDNYFDFVRQLKNGSFLGSVFVHVTGQSSFSWSKLTLIELKCCPVLVRLILTSTFDFF
jgi:hypothetical protein